MGAKVRDDVNGIAFAADPDAEGDGWIEVSARDMAAGENHHGEGRTNCERSHGSGTGGDYRHADREDEKERTDELDQIFFHIDRWLQEFQRIRSYLSRSEPKVGEDTTR